MAHLKTAVSKGDHTLGNPKAAKVLVEYGDYQCPHCGLAFPFINRLLDNYGDEILFVFRNFPLQESHPAAMMAALAAEAAGLQGKFWEMHDMIFEHQASLSADTLLHLAEKLQLDMQKFSQDWRSQELMSRVEGDFEGGLRSGVNGTPTFFLNGARYDHYNETYESLEQMMRD
ncbi:Thioredoxin [Chitinophaga jiangningensis]|uniref:Thioredoxin n=1 Tax=Chitinophaga jiangningensis TaxID=1419482 RepID=A0A1M7BXE8_9BACT|nr:thioredoxin domain-containing protein [Chitinophaga jiangningensis]SHL59634.1 Thioredoxin [Chitinophaga jiangningensis]